MNEMKKRRRQRLEDAAQCRQPDRVPFAVNINDYYAKGYGLSIYDVMKDARFLQKTVLQFVDEFNPDWVCMPLSYPVDALELTGAKHMRYPGPGMNLPVDTPYQYIDQCYLEEDDYDVYLKDPSNFIFHKVFPKVYPAFAPLASLDMTMLTNSIYNLAALSVPDVQDAVKKLLKTGKIVGNYLQQIDEIGVMLEQAGYPIFGDAALLNPFDAFADGVRGIMDAAMDTLAYPEELKESLQHWGDLCIDSTIERTVKNQSKYLFMPLHCGGEMFMSVDNYEEFYWPQIKRCINSAVKSGLTPIVFCEGSYTSRLDILADIPEGKVIYLFEDIDLKKAKKILHGKACIMGGMKTQTLMYGSEEDVIEETKRILDICAPGGGFIMSNSLALDIAQKKNLEVWREAVDKYGTY